MQKEVADIIKDKILIGHSIDYDLKALLLSHPYHLIRDTAKYAPLMRKIKDKKAKPHALRHLARTQLKVIIQSGEHDPVRFSFFFFSFFLFFNNNFDILIFILILFYYF